ncbi:MAG: hypothetical protein AVDCRST_MAG73-3554 [uncultured Thermomicrobiales bacterium]|uniref:DUF3105 domain-containing protein n=1 Tax=uncultured Thermomicrobiales bacterium TaxID=1645740 RepID=A0A6J4UTB2_9BACT|nr:MAG: hypothetical protein AVDCRST_MAG73-3554 [uncultured Thermomicrobiales bacterium]
MANKREHQQQPEQQQGPARTPRPRTEAAQLRRDQRLAAIERDLRRRRLRRVGLGIVALALAAVVVVVAVQATREDDDETAAGPPAGTQTFAYLGGVHTEEPVAYAEVPPAGGPHSAVWQNCGYYAEPVGNEHAVHSLEHGAVWLTYRPDLPADQVATLQDLAENQDHVLVSPYPGLPSPVVASAWNAQVMLDGPADPRLEQFMREYRLSPDAPEPGALCSNGTSETV